MRRLAQVTFSSQRQVPLARAVAGLAADIQLFKGGGEAVRGRIVVFLQIGAVALGTAGVPVVVGPGPMQWIAVVYGFVRKQVEPALAALFRGPAVPGYREGLQAAP